MGRSSAGAVLLRCIHSLVLGVPPRTLFLQVTGSKPLLLGPSLLNPPDITEVLLPSGPDTDPLSPDHWLVLSAILIHVCQVTSVLSDSETPWTVPHQVPQSMGFSRQEYWNELPCPPPGGVFPT